MRKTIALATSVTRRKLRKPFCASLARGRFHTAWVNFGSRTVRLRGLLCPRERTSSVQSPKSVSCHERKSVGRAQKLIALGRYACPLPINISTLMTRRPLDSNWDSRAVTSVRIKRRSASERARYACGMEPRFNGIPIIIKTRNHIFAGFLLYTDILETCAGEQRL